MDYPIGIFRGTTPLGCIEQIARARTRVTSALEVKTADNRALEHVELKRVIPPEGYMGCGCRIAENGCIDPSECGSLHILVPVPMLIRWCDASTCLLMGGGYLIIWSGWARPAVFSLLGRFPMVKHVKHVIAHSSQNTLHTNYRFDYRNREDPHLGGSVIDLIVKRHTDKEYRRARELLDSLPAVWRIGQHNNSEFPIHSTIE